MMNGAFVCTPNVAIFVDFFLAKKVCCKGFDDDYDDDDDDDYDEGGVGNVIVVLLELLLAIIHFEFKFTSLQIGVDMKCGFVAN